ncbi:MAG: 4-deoxy-4-formamido-L-arabinose-phosphoundecaprenol deformylase [Burkholderiaceae bacterium]|nr:MAG: 4-deoxy-4-formamido-L-arabinose-phosphoundecaprenol deformylase [Burkholderiaceae bacterium]
MPGLALKVDVDTLRGTQEGVPNLLRLLDQVQARATFLFSLGPDHTGWAIRRAFRPGFFSKVQRTSVLSHYGLKTLLYGTLLPAPDIGLRTKDILRSVRDAGHEVGVHTWDHVLWQDNVRARNGDWTRKQMQRACDRFVDIFGTPPTTHGAAGWQMNDHAFVCLDELGLRYASDTRGGQPFTPVIAGKKMQCVQLPTTLPTLDEIIGVDDMDENAAADHVLAQTTQNEQIFTLHAELEGRKLLPQFERLLRGWQDQGFHLQTLAQSFAALPTPPAPRSPLWGTLPGRSGEVMT